MSSFQIGVISTSIVLGPHINLLQREIIDQLVINNKNETHFLLVHEKFFSLSHNQQKSPLLHNVPVLFKISEEGESTQGQKQ